MAEAKVSVRSDLLKIAEDLKIIARTAEDTAASLSEATKNVADNVNDQTAVVAGGMNRLRKYGKDLAKSIASDFKGLLSVNAIASGLKLNEQFAGSIKQAITLNDAIRNLSPVFGMTESSAERFKRTLVKGLAEIGAGSDAAAQALAGLAETPVRGEQALSAYARTAVELAGVSGQRGKEADIARGLSRVVTAQGGNPNDPAAMQRVADDIVRIRNATGKSATEALSTLEDMFSSANSQMKQKLMGGGAVSLSMASLIGGAGSTDFLKRFLGMDWRQRAGMEAQGLGRLIGPNGQLNAGAFQQTIETARGRGAGNVEAGLTTMGMTDDEAKGFMRLAEAMRQNGEAIERARKAQVDINSEYRKTMGLGDAFRANINRVKGGITSVLDAIGAPDLINKGTGALVGASQSGVGSAAVVGGSAVLAAMLTSKGIGGLGKVFGLGGLAAGEAKSKAIEAMTGEHVQRVEVVNWPASMGGGDMGAAAAMGLPNMAKKAGGALGVFGGPLGIAAGLAAIFSPEIGGALGKGVYAAKRGIGGDSETEAQEFMRQQEEFRAKRVSDAMQGKDYRFTHDVKVVVDTRDKSLKAFAPPSRGVTQ